MQPGGGTRSADYRRARRLRARRKREIRRRLAAGVVLAVLAALAVALLSGGSSRTPTRAATSSRHTRAAHASSVHANGGHATAAATRPAPPAAPSPGSLPQTDAYPSAGDARFHSLMASLWRGIVHNSTSAAIPAFFPKGAYVQLKAIGGAGSDWTNRLVEDYSLDIGAAHALLGSDAASAHLVRAEVPSSYGHWISPGGCYNSVGYYELPNARIVYSEDGQLRSFGIASMISWRGVWYVVHLGAVLRSSETGIVDEPASGPGESAYSGTC
jgi:hypothetical protein